MQYHRGPNDGGCEVVSAGDGSWVGLGSRRLSIIDLSTSGHMPMWNDDRTICIAYNGEVYNFRELRDELVSRGQRFRSSSDTEVVLKLYEEHGEESIARLEGMFAFVLFDKRRNQLVIARDGFGIKPFYYSHRGREFACASELKALLCVPGIEARMSPAALSRYLTFLWVPEPETLVEGIHKLPAGHYGVLKDGNLRLHEFWDPTFPAQGESSSTTFADAVVGVRDRFRTSVEQQLVSDVPIGAFLSAGLDSSSIVALMSQAHSQPVHTYCITFPESMRVGENTLDDPHVARRVAHELGCEHEEIELDPDVTDLLPKCVWHMDEPVADPAILNTYVLCAEAAKSSTVLLSGVGGDELFAGYRKYYAHYWAEAYCRLPKSMRQRVLEPAVGRLPMLRGSRWKGIVRLMQKMSRSASLSPRERFVMNGTYLNDAERHSLFTAEFAEQLPAEDSCDIHQETFARVADRDFLHQMLYMDMKLFMTSLNLNYNDKMSMASSVEIRVPFLSRQLCDYAAHHVRPEWKLSGFWRPTTKYILREAMKGIVPDCVMRQPKAGFFAPVDTWLAGDLQPLVDDLLSERQIQGRGIFRPGRVREMIDDHRRGRRNWSMQIWQLLTLELWMRTFADTNRESDAHHLEIAV